MTSLLALQSAIDAQPKARAARYQRMVTVNVRHAYYNRGGDKGGGPCSDLAIRPTPRTLARLARYGLLVRSRPDGIEILSNDRHSRALRESMDALRKRVGGSLPPGTAEHLFGPPLLFTVDIVNPAFLNITETPEDSGSGTRALILSNRRTSVAADDGTARMLLGNRRTLQRRPRTPPIPLKADMAAALRQPHPHGAEWWREPSAAFEAADAERRSLASSLQGLSFAWLELHVAPPTPTGRERQTGLYPIILDPEGAGPAEDESGGHLRPTRYDIVFPARSTRWRYIVADRRGSLRRSDLHVFDKQGELAGFTSEPHDPPPGAASALAFTSPASFPIGERPSQRFKLGTRRSDSNRCKDILCDPLPAPGPDLLTIRGADGLRISEMHLFL